ncbi:hypothetical protein GM418_17130 [Maribellus comscasis]|uniref:DNA alkylation repair protein n=1 Tax=Maribellus comscasis TaxID=2681766 RepID=A0A6I6K5P3_9BACT|nr:DNA alkylation repair protein [Maribellus comscasis]QGY45334.1 hypothetical protein GM418_17130 [Maribellus comscasis]
MDFILDNQETEQKFQKLLSLIKSRKNGDVSVMMSQKGLKYKLNWGVSLIELREIAKQFESDHLLALKLWNKQWRETMILASLLDEPEKVTEEQMDYWTKSFENTEIAEQVSANLWVKCKFAFVKALEWCRGKKYLVHFTGIHLMSRLAVTEKNAIDEMFEPFYAELEVLARNTKLHTIIYRSVIALGSRSALLNTQSVELALQMQQSDFEDTVKLGETLYEELTSPYFKEIGKTNPNKNL